MRRSKTNAKLRASFDNQRAPDLWTRVEAASREAGPVVYASPSSSWTKVGPIVLSALLVGVSFVILYAQFSPNLGGTGAGTQPSVSPTESPPTPSPSASLPGARTGTIDVGGPATGLVDAFDSMWVLVDAPIGTVQRIDPATNGIVASIDLQSTSPIRITANASSVWVLDRDGVVSQIDPNTNEVEQTINAGPESTDITVTEGSVWVAHWSGELARFSIGSTATSKIRLPDQQISSITSGEGEVWAVSSMTGAVYQIDEATEKIVGQVQSGGNPNLAFGFGAAWVTDSSGNLIGIDPTTSSIQSTTDFSEGAPAPISYAPVATGDFVWVISNEGKIFRIDPNTRRVVSRPAPSGLVGLDAADGSLWLVDGTARVERTPVSA